MRKYVIIGKDSSRAEEPNVRRVLSSLPETLRGKLPSTWSLDVGIEPPVRATRARALGRPDAEVVIEAPDGSRTTLLVEAKRSVDPKLVPVLVDQLRRYADALRDARGMVVAPFLSRRARELLAEAGLSYADATGNIRLVLERPAVYIETSGASSNPWARPGERPLRSLKGPTAGRVVRALCDLRPPFGVEELAKRSATSLGSVSRVFAFLDPEGLITREPRGPVTDVKWAELIRRWAEDYAFARTNTSRTYLEPRGLTALLDKLKRVPLRYAITGSLAAAEVAPVAASRLAMLYVDDADRASEALSLRRAETGANVVLAEPFDKVVFERTWDRNGLTYAALSQVAVDLLTGPGRGPAEGEALIQWMQGHERVWRS